MKTSFTLYFLQSRKEFRKRAQSPHRSPSPDSKPPTPTSRTPRRSPSPKVSRRSQSPGFRMSRSLSEDTMASDIIEEVNESDVQSASSEDVFRGKYKLMRSNVWSCCCNKKYLCFRGKYTKICFYGLVAVTKKYCFDLYIILYQI